MDLVVHKVDGCSIVSGVTGREGSVFQQLVNGGAAIGFAVHVRRETAFKKAEAGEGGDGAGDGVGGAGLEPAVGTGADPGEDDALLPGEAENSGKVPLPPEREHALGIASADDNGVEFEEVAFEVGGGRGKEGEEGGIGAEGGVHFIKLDDGGRRVGGGMGEKADFGPGLPGGLHDVAVETRIVGFHEETSSAHGNDLFELRHRVDQNSRTRCAQGAKARSSANRLNESPSFG